MSGKASQLQALLQPSIEALGVELWGLELKNQGRGVMLRIYIESENGISVDDCARVSHQVSGVLDVEDPISSEYVLEVSSPGMDRPIFTLEQYQALVGEDIKCKLRFPFDGQRSFRGRLVAVEGDEIVLRDGEEEILLPFEQIEKASVVPRF